MKSKRKVFLVMLITILLVSLCNMPVKAQNEMSGYNDLLTRVEVIDSIKRSKYNNILTKESPLETEFNLKDELQKSSIPIRVKNQLNSGSCWAFAFSSVLETTLSKKNGTLFKEVSPMHLEYVTTKMYNRALGSGGSSRIAVAYSVSGKGPVEESELPFNSVYTGTFKPIAEVGNLDKPIIAKINETSEYATLYKKIDGDKVKCYKDAAKTSEYSDSEMKVARDLIKQHIKENGAVSALMYIDTTNYYDTSNKAYNYNDYESPTPPNHEITLVGWDDEYEPTNFKDGKQPKNKGAYIAVNSYGESFGNEGYIYISYEDAYIEQNPMGVKDIAECIDGEKKYDHIHQYDELGMNIGLPLNKKASPGVAEKTVYAAAKYSKSAPSEKDEYIDEIGLYIFKTSGVKVYINPNNDDLSANNFQEVASPEQPLETGYHTVKLSTPMKINGDKFAIKVKYTNQEGAYIPIEANYQELDIREGALAFYDKAVAKAGETFVAIDENHWHDIIDVSALANGVQKRLLNSSACIKAFTTYQDKPVVEPSEEPSTNPSEKPSEEPSANPSTPPSEEPSTKPSERPSENTTISVQSVELNKSKLTLEEGKSANLVVTFNPTNATNKNVKWTSSNEGVATVSDTGIITAQKPGRTTITVISEDGNKTDECELTVTAKQADPDDIYDDDEGKTSGNDGTIVSTGSGSGNYGNSAYQKLPYAGNEAMILIIAVATITSIIIFVRYRKYKDIK